MFEFAGSIPHIDSDAEDDKESIRSGRLMLSGDNGIIFMWWWVKYTLPVKNKEHPEKKRVMVFLFRK